MLPTSPLSGLGGSPPCWHLLCFSPKAVLPEPLCNHCWNLRMPGAMQRLWGHQNEEKVMHTTASPVGETAYGNCGSTQKLFQANILRLLGPHTVGCKESYFLYGTTNNPEEPTQS